MKRPDPRAICATCAHFQAEDTETPNHCRRYPPQIIHTDKGTEVAWPGVEADGHCGEWTPSIDTVKQ